MHLIRGNALSIPLKAQSVQCCVTSPPYWGLRDYSVEGQLGLEATPEEYVEKMVSVFREVWRVLKDDGTLWLNLGDSYAGSWGAQSRVDGNDLKSNLSGGSMLSARQILAHPKRTHTGSLKNTPNLKPKDLIGIPWRVAFALQADGWYLRSDIIWAKPNPMPESVTDRPTKAHEYLFLLTKNARYLYDAAAIGESLQTAESENYLKRARIIPGRGKQAGVGQHPSSPQQDHSGGFPPSYRGSSFTKGKTAHGKDNIGQGPRQEAAYRNKRTVWTVATQPTPHTHFATFPEKLIEPCILAGSAEGDLVFDPFVGSGTVCRVATANNRIGVGMDLAYQEIAQLRNQNIQRKLIGL